MRSPTTRRSSTRSTSDAARADLPRAVQERRDPGRRADRPARARSRRVRRARLLPVGGRRAVRRERARRAFATGGSVKWLCGGPGAGCLWVHPDIAEHSSRPSSAGRATRAFAFEPELQYADGRARFLTGTPNMPALSAATRDTTDREVGVDRIRERSLVLTRLLIDLLEGAGFEIAHPARPRASRRHRPRDTPDHAAVHQELGEREIICDFRPGAGIRLGPHFYNTEAELRQTVGRAGGDRSERCVPAPSGSRPVSKGPKCRPFAGRCDFLDNGR